MLGGEGMAGMTGDGGGGEGDLERTRARRERRREVGFYFVRDKGMQFWHPGAYGLAICATETCCKICARRNNELDTSGGKCRIWD